MSWDYPVFKIPGLIASGDLSSDQFKLVKKNTTDNQVALNDVAGGPVVGVLYNKPDAANEAAEVVNLGVAKVTAGATITAGDHIVSNASGTAAVAASGATGGDVGDFVVGIALEGCSSGEKFALLLVPTFNGVPLVA